MCILVSNSQYSDIILCTANDFFIPYTSYLKKQEFSIHKLITCIMKSHIFSCIILCRFNEHYYFLLIATSTSSVKYNNNNKKI